MRCIAIDDEPLALRQMKSYIEKTPFLSLVAVCESALQALEVLEKESVDLLFVDINMPDLSGMDFVKTLEKGSMVIFTTAYSEYAIEGFKVNAVDYLLKPIGYPDFLQGAQKARDLYELKSAKNTIDTKITDGYLFVKSEYKIVRVNLKDITYIEGMREYVRIHLDRQKPIMTLLSMKAFESELPKSEFMRVHRSYIVNLNKINTIERQRIVFNGDTYIPVSEQYKERFQQFVDAKFL
ncbi:MAG: LytTR family DNA-binding domain-containing protein [Salinivirgaceae bacterium]|jgi:DNA-binding LytR/AlgR family response regulator|nr:LytTR family DNA-binding domain-containing protein [Salinivirgaceae bacterium]